MTEPFKVFISHKADDSEIASHIQQALTKLFDPIQKGLLSCFLSERIVHGEDWLKELHSELHLARYLLLVFTDPKEDWSWCMYETGYYSALRYLQDKDQLSYGRQRRIICLHHADLPPPSPLAHLQATKATRARVTQFIRNLLADSGISIEEKPAVDDNQSSAPQPGLTVTAEKVQEAVDSITDQFNLKDAVRLKTHSLALVIKGGSGSEKPPVNPLDDLEYALSEESYFSGSDESLRAIFQRSADRNQLSWKEAVETSRRRDAEDGQQQFDIRWLAELVDVMYNASNHYYPQKPIRGLVFTGANGIVYSPVIQEISEHRSGTISCDIVFLKWEGSQYPKAPDHIRHLLIATRMATRFRQEFIEEFRDIAEVAKMASDFGQAYSFRRQLWRAFYDVMTEGISRGLDTRMVSKAFGDHGRQILREMTVEYGQCQVALAKIVRGQLDLSTYLVEDDRGDSEKFTKEELEKLADIYDSLSRMNFKFLAMSSLILEDYYASTEEPGKWQETKAELSGILPMSRRRVEPMVPPSLSPAQETKPPELAVIGGLEHSGPK